MNDSTEKHLVGVTTLIPGIATDEKSPAWNMRLLVRKALTKDHVVVRVEHKDNSGVEIRVRIVDLQRSLAPFV